ncbi:MAG: hypothetical protein V1925_00925 [Candidatus Omnitrophota bacterium]
MPTVNNFSFMLTPVTVAQLKSAWPIIRLVPDFIIKSSAGYLPPLKISRVRYGRSSRGREIDGYLIICSLLHREPSGLGEDFILDKIIAAGQIARRLGCVMLGLGGYSSILSARGYDKIAQNLKIPVTNGSALTVWTVIEALYRAARIKKIALQGLNAAIIGNDTCIGRLSAVKLLEFGLRVDKGGAEALKQADIVINAANSTDGLINIKDLKPGVIFCDVSLFSLAEKAKLRDDINVIEAGLIKLPSGQVISAGMAEAILLAFGQRFVSFYLGTDINPDRVEEIADIAAWHGFEVYASEAPVL